MNRFVRNRTIIAETQNGRVRRYERTDGQGKMGRTGEEGNGQTDGRSGGQTGEGETDSPTPPPHSPLLPTPRAPSTARRTWVPGGPRVHSAMGASRKCWDMLGRRMGGAARRLEGSVRAGLAWAGLGSVRAQFSRQRSAQAAAGGF